MYVILDRSRADNSTDPRDKIHSILPPITEAYGRGEEVPKVDYSKAVAHVYEEFTRYLIKHTGGLLTFFWQTATKSIEGLPSLVPDFTVRRATQRWIEAQICQQAAPEEDFLPSAVHEETLEMSKPGELALKGKMVGNATVVGGRYPKAESAGDDAQFRSDMSCFRIGNEKMVEGLLNTNASLEPDGEAIWQIIESLVHPKAGRGIARADFVVFATSSNSIGVSRPASKWVILSSCWRADIVLFF